VLSAPVDDFILILENSPNLLILNDFIKTRHREARSDEAIFKLADLYHKDCCAGRLGPRVRYDSVIWVFQMLLHDI
jgi:hypothetical protein